MVRCWVTDTEIDLGVETSRVEHAKRRSLCGWWCHLEIDCKKARSPCHPRHLVSLATSRCSRHHRDVGGSSSRVVSPKRRDRSNALHTPWPSLSVANFPQLQLLGSGAPAGGCRLCTDGAGGPCRGLSHGGGGRGNHESHKKLEKVPSLPANDKLGISLSEWRRHENMEGVSQVSGS